MIIIIIIIKQRAAAIYHTSYLSRRSSLAADLSNIIFSIDDPCCRVYIETQRQRGWTISSISSQYIAAVPLTSPVYYDIKKDVKLLPPANSIPLTCGILSQSAAMRSIIQIKQFKSFPQLKFLPSTLYLLVCLGAYLLRVLFPVFTLLCSLLFCQSSFSSSYISIHQSSHPSIAK